MKELQKFYEKMRENEALQNEIEALNKEFEYEVVQSMKMQKKAAERLVELAKKYEIKLTVEDFLNQNTGQLNDHDLDAVAGGGSCYCVVGGGGTAGQNNKGIDETCACVLAGFGEGCSNGGGGFRCKCPMFGGGDSLMD